ncbi:hypothetical protein ACHZ98_33865 [Streptomyces sp. MAR4 CNY-716]
MPDVTRLEIADLLADRFDTGAADTRELRAAAARSRPEVRAVLEQLPQRRYSTLRELWEDLPTVPVGL